MPTEPRPPNHLASFRYALEGITHAFRTQRHMRFHFFILVLVLLLGLLLDLGSVKLAILLVAAAGVLVAEMINTALESVVDLVTQTYHPLAKVAKDVGAGAVLIAAIAASVVGLMLFFGDRKIALLHIAVGRDPRPLHVLLTVLMLVVVIVLIGKALGGKGSLLSGGAVSGHAAVSFFLASTLIYRAADYFTSVLALLLACLVAQSRVEGKIHTVQEVVIGGLLGALLTGGAYLIHVFP